MKYGNGGTYVIDWSSFTMTDFTTLIGGSGITLTDEIFENVVNSVGCGKQCVVQLFDSVRKHVTQYPAGVDYFIDSDGNTIITVAAISSLLPNVLNSNYILPLVKFDIDCATKIITLHYYTIS